MCAAVGRRASAAARRPHSHVHTHADGTVHLHRHTHADEHAHAHTETDAADPAKRTSITPWVLFTIFVFGPCEPLIPLLMYPAATSGWASVAAVTAVFAASTLAVMLFAVAVARQGLERFSAVLPLRRLERYADAAAGAAVLLCGVAVTLGL